MTKWVNNSAWNALLAKINTANKVLILPSYTNDYNTANSQKLGEGSYSTSSQTFPTAGERVVTLNPANNLSVTKTGTATHVAYVNGTEMLFVTDIAGQAVTQGGTANLTGVQLKAEDI
jgi:hypothetical protein|nr:MAG TPA: hypothetical protein [Caudoviricetes sp.]DAI33207.1 MAG TPA: hypothetical protein [Caudoviricetes sp.]DAJ31036.1 MAG TPA: hypothetical protein [Caudoviricetes sp.]DAJ83772.1 MAG TPA: hypothetical protein [Caudoviricetes sp.]